LGSGVAEQVGPARKQKGRRKAGLLSIETLSSG
jgi:hypothetical protein